MKLADFFYLLTVLCLVIIFNTQVLDEIGWFGLELVLTSDLNIYILKVSRADHNNSFAFADISVLYDRI
mgnify:CR=1 FL=1